MITNTHIRYSKAKFIHNQTRKLAEERLVYMGGKRLGDVSIGIEDNASCRKIRRIIEKRTAQQLKKNKKAEKLTGNATRYNTRRNVSNQFKNLFGQVPAGFHYCA